MFWFHSVQSRRGSAILIALIILSLLAIVTTVFLEKIWWFSKSSNGIEASNRAYYFAAGVIEEQLMDPAVNKFQPWNIVGTGSAPSSFGTGARMTVITWGTLVPASGKGNSPFNKDYNIISLGEPVQLVVPNWVTWSNVRFYFQVPAIGSASTWVSTTPNSGAILWTIWNTGASLFASGELNIFRYTDIDGTNKNINNKYWITNTGDLVQFDYFYGNVPYLGAGWSSCTNYNCTLKLSLIRTIPTTDGRMLPFLEYKIDFDTTTLPSQYMTLQTDGYAHGFLRSRTVKVQQITTNTALDFAVLQ